jgi:hypothetical protein
MQHTITGGRRQPHHLVGEAVWIIAGIVVMLAFGDALVLLALAVAIVTMTSAWWTYRKVEHRVQRDDAELASVTPLRPALAGQRGPKQASQHVSWGGPSAA